MAHLYFVLSMSYQSLSPTSKKKKWTSSTTRRILLPSVFLVINTHDHLSVSLVKYNAELKSSSVPLSCDLVDINGRPHEKIWSSVISSRTGKYTSTNIHTYV